MAKRKPREVDRREIGMYLSKGKAGPHAHLIYEVYYNDGTTKTERGHTVFAWPGLRECNPWMIPKSQKALNKKLYRPDLSTVMEMMAVGWERLSSACYHADTHKDKPIKGRVKVKIKEEKKRGK